ncbi:glycosyltransferase 87 family protein [Rubrobacter marinus]|uniref:glycosyltransferase 87 family protein n=1 Tax=Rubrobacter marinus TaxID=2653852 RepID=UPI001407CF21|nr:glycosyltransferase 87 family protein [Rubrobacter marinus]
MCEKRGYIRRPAFLALLFAAAHALVLLVLTLYLYSSDAREPAFQVEIFRAYAERIFSGETPYSGFPYEYPPSSLLVLLLPGLASTGAKAYATAFGIEMLLLDWAVLYVLSRVGRRAVILYGVAFLLFWRLPFIRHDLAPVAAATTGAYLLLRGRGAWAAVLWGVGGALKLYPMVAAPALAFGAGLPETLKRWAVAAAVFAGGVLWGVLAFGPEALSFLAYHADRPAMIESLPANVLLLLPGAEVVRSYGSFNVVGPLGESLVNLFGVLQLLAVGGALLLAGRGWRRAPVMGALRAAAAATFAFAVFGKVLSPHFLLWPLPLLTLVTELGGVRHARAAWALYLAAIVLTTAINEQYWAISGNLPYFTAMLSARNGLLLPLFALLLLRPEEDEEQEEDEAEGDQGVS